MLLFLKWDSNTKNRPGAYSDKSVRRLVGLI